VILNIEENCDKILSKLEWFCSLFNIKKFMSWSRLWLQNFIYKAGWGFFSWKRVFLFPFLWKKKAVSNSEMM